MKIFTDEGYLNMKAIIDTKLSFIIIVGARAVGKTYGALSYALETGRKFIYMRNTQEQANLISKNEFSPFKSITRDTGIEIITKPISKYNAAFYKAKENEQGELLASGPAIGYTMALSTVSNIRGFDASDVELLFWDEFCPEVHEKKIKNMGDGFLNAYETINRNRELKNCEPLQAILMANANDLANPVFMSLRIINKVEHMMRKGQVYSLDYERGIGIFLIGNSEISKRKQNTALYRLTSGSDYGAMALANEFAEIRHGSINPQPIKEYIPIATIGEITFYKHKNNKMYYCTTMKVGTPREYEPNDTGIKRFARDHSYIYRAYMKNNIYFEDTTAEVIYKSYMG